MKDMNPSQPGIRSNRILSMFLDHALMTIVWMVALAPWMIGLSERMETADPSQPMFYLPDWAMLLWAAGGSLYLNKDIRRGQSFAKQMFGFRVVDASTGGAVTPLRLLLRNLTAIIWPVEVVLNLRDPSRRSGDHLAGTRLVLSEGSDDFPLAKTGSMLVSLVVGFLLTLALTWGGSQALRSTFTPDFVRSTYNEELGGRLSDHLLGTGQAYIAEANFDVFDSARAMPGGYIQGMVGVRADSLLTVGFPAVEALLLRSVMEATSLGDYQAVIRYYPADDPRKDGTHRSYRFPAGELADREEISGTWYPAGHAIPEDLQGPGDLSILPFARELDSAEHIAIDETGIPALISVYADSLHIASAWAYHLSMADSSFYAWSEREVTVASRMIMRTQDEIYLRSSDGILLKLSREP